MTGNPSPLGDAPVHTLDLELPRPFNLTERRPPTFKTPGFFQPDNSHFGPPTASRSFVLADAAGSPR